MDEIRQQLNILTAQQKDTHAIFKPSFFRISQSEDKSALNQLLTLPGIIVSDRIMDQLKELIKYKNPTRKLTDEELAIEIVKQLGNQTIEEYGVWVFYPWSGRLVHILDEEEFVIVRTNRNMYKITPEERATLSSKKVGVIGLSVGQSVALTMAMERSFGELRIADFDHLDMSNLNRIRTGIHNLNLKKTIITAREIAEIDPYLNVNCFHEGITEQNIESFFTEGGKLDALIEECDGLHIKIESRKLAKQMRIPVIMDTSDRGMMDIERFDLEPERPIFHGLLDKFDLTNIKEINETDRMAMIFAILDKEKISDRFRNSIYEIGKTITTWPQLASAVIAGGANAADIYRRIMLGISLSSGRYYVDIEESII